MARHPFAGTGGDRCPRRLGEGKAAARNRLDYNPWGGELQFLNNDSNHYKFTGKERDNETQLDYFGARYYSNFLGRWVTPDWAAKAAAVPYVEFADPQSLNLYSYVRNTPTTRYDADGHQHCPPEARVSCQDIPPGTVGAPSDNKFTTNSQGNIICTGNCPGAAMIANGASAANNMADASVEEELGFATFEQHGDRNEANVQAIPTIGVTIGVDIPRQDPSEGPTKTSKVSVPMAEIGLITRNGQPSGVSLRASLEVSGPKQVEEAMHGVGVNTQTSAENFVDKVATAASATGAFLKSVGGAIGRGLKAFEDSAKPTFDPYAQD